MIKSDSIHVVPIRKQQPENVQVSNDQQYEHEINKEWHLLLAKQVSVKACRKENVASPDSASKMEGI